MSSRWQTTQATSAPVRRFARNAATKKPWVKAELCEHLWVGELPGDLEVGTHCITVRVTDEYGRAHQDHLVLEVVARQAARATVPE